MLGRGDYVAGCGDYNGIWHKTPSLLASLIAILPGSIQLVIRGQPTTEDLAQSLSLVEVELVTSHVGVKNTGVGMLLVNEVHFWGTKHLEENYGKRLGRKPHQKIQRMSWWLTNAASFVNVRQHSDLQWTIAVEPTSMPAASPPVSARGRCARKYKCGILQFEKYSCSSYTSIELARPWAKTIVFSTWWGTVVRVGGIKVELSDHYQPYENDLRIVSHTHYINKQNWTLPHVRSELHTMCWKAHYRWLFIG